MNPNNLPCLLPQFIMWIANINTGGSKLHSTDLNPVEKLAGEVGIEPTKGFLHPYPINSRGYYRSSHSPKEIGAASRTRTAFRFLTREGFTISKFMQQRKYSTLYTRRRDNQAQLGAGFIRACSLHHVEIWWDDRDLNSDPLLKREKR